MKKSVLAFVFVTIACGVAGASTLRCADGDIKTKAKFVSEPTCDSGIGALYAGNGRCVTETTAVKIQSLKLDTNYEVCLQEYPGTVRGNLVVGVNMVGQNQDGTLVLE